MLEIKTGEEKPSTFPTDFIKSDFINIWKGYYLLVETH